MDLPLATLHRGLRRVFTLDFRRDLCSTLLVLDNVVLFLFFGGGGNIQDVW